MPETEYKESKALVEELCRNKYNRELLLFLARHPYARFNRPVLVNGLGLSNAGDIEATLAGLIVRGMIETKASNGSSPSLYWLTRCEPAHSAIKAVFAPRTCRAEEAQPTIGIMQLTMPLVPCPALAIVK